MLHGHGDDGYLFSREVVADFSTNVWYGGEPEGLKEHLFNHWKSINKYPEVLGEGLIKRISEHHHLSPDNILINNGSIESIYSIAQAFKKNKTTIAVPAFAEYEDACKMYGHELNFIEWENLDSSIQLNTDVFFLCNPNNPTGEAFLTWRN